jgi:Flp pilus assembly protein TadD
MRLLIAAIMLTLCLTEKHLISAFCVNVTYLTHLNLQVTGSRIINRLAFHDTTAGWELNQAAKTQLNNLDIWQQLQAGSLSAPAVRKIVELNGIYGHLQLRPFVIAHCGLTLFDAGDARTAVSLMRGASPDSERLAFNRGQAALQKGQLPRAADYFELTVTINPRFARGWYALGAALWSSGNQNARMIQAWENGIQVAENDVSTERYFAEGRLRITQGRWAEAIVALTHIAEGVPGECWAHHFLGVALYHEGQFNRSISEMDAALRGCPESPWSHVYRGYALCRLGQHSNAQLAYATASSLLPNDKYIHDLQLGITQAPK